MLPRTSIDIESQETIVLARHPCGKFYNSGENGMMASMSQLPTKPHWFRFGLRTFLVLIVLFGGWLGWNAYKVRQRREYLDYLAAKGVVVIPLSDAPNPHSPWVSGRLPVVWRLMGAEPIFSITICDTANELTRADGRDVARLFPEADVTFTDGRTERVEACPGD